MSTDDPASPTDDEAGDGASEVDRVLLQPSLGDHVAGAEEAP